MIRLETIASRVTWAASAKAFFDRVGVAVVKVERQVARRLGMDLRRARFQRLGRRGDGGQLLDVELDGLGGVLGLNRRLGHHTGYRLTDIAHLALGERRPRRRLHRRTVALRDVHAALERPETRRFQIGVGEDRQHARHGRRRLGVDAFQDTVRDLAAHHRGIDLARQVDVVGVAPLTAQQRRIFLARHRLADTEFHQGEAGVVERVHYACLQTSPHPEERRGAARLEGWATTRLVPTLRDGRCAPSSG